MTSSNVLRDWWSTWRCTQARLAYVKVFGRSVGGVADVAVDAFAALEQALTATGYEPDDVWAYNCRPIAGKDTPSLHSYGIAIDIDPKLNPYTGGSPWSGAFTEGQVVAVEAIRTEANSQLWTWGGRWSTPDRMHFQLNVHPSDTAVDWSTVEGEEVAQFTEEEAKELRTFLSILNSLGSDVSFVRPAIQLIRDERRFPLHSVERSAIDVVARGDLDELKEILRGV